MRFERDARFKQNYLTLNPDTDWWRRRRRISPLFVFCYPVPVRGSILALDSTEHTCCGERRAEEHLLWSVAAGKLFHFDKMACGNTMA